MSTVAITVEVNGRKDSTRLTNVEDGDELKELQRLAKSAEGGILEDVIRELIARKIGV
jgi:hypothetical protein